MNSLSGGWEEATGPLAVASVAAVLTGLGKAGVGWTERVALYQSLQATLQHSGSRPAAAADVMGSTDRLMAALLEGCGDAHFRVASSALAALGTGLACPCISRAFEPQLDRIMPALFARCELAC